MRSGDGFVIAKPGQFTEEAKASFKEIGIRVIECEDPSSVVIHQHVRPFRACADMGGLVLEAALEAAVCSPEARKLFSMGVAERILAARSLKPKEPTQ